MTSASTMTIPTCFRANFVPLLQCMISFRSQPLISYGCRRKMYHAKCVYRVVKCRAVETETISDEDKDKGQPNQLEILNRFLDSTKAQGLSDDKGQCSQLEALNMLLNKDGHEAKPKQVTMDADNIEITNVSPLPFVKPQHLDGITMIPKETVDVLKDQVFGFDTFFITSNEPYQGGVLFKGNLRGSAAASYKKIEKRLQDTFGDQYKLFLLISPEDDKPVAVVVPRKTLQPETTDYPQWFAAGAFGLVTIFTLLVLNVPALQSNLLSIFDNTDLIKDGLPGALVTALALGVHEIAHILVARNAGVKLGVPYFVPSWQIGSFGSITRILNIVPNREVLLKIAASGPFAGFSLGLVLLLLGFYLPPTDGIGIVVDASIFHKSFLVGGIAKLLFGDVIKEGAMISMNPLAIWAWAGLLINAINSIPAGELDGGRISFALWGRKAAYRLSAASIVMLGLFSLQDDVAFYWLVLIFFLQRGPIAPLAEELSEPDNKYVVALGILVLVMSLLVCLPYPFPFTTEAITSLY